MLKEMIIKYNNGTQTGSDAVWSNPSYAWDDNDSNRASCLAPGSMGDTNSLWGTAHDSTGTNEIITKVEIGIATYQDSGTFVAMIQAGFNGGATGSEEFSVVRTVESITYHDVTNDYNAPNPWTWTDINNLDVIYYGMGGFSAAKNHYVNQFYIKVTWLDVKGPFPVHRIP